MSRISELFKQRAKILSIYCTAGFPKLNSTIEIMQSLQENGADMIELGMPYSDPLADGPTIQQSSSIALANGMTIKKLFDQIKDLREVIHVPVVLMGYMNPVLQFGFEKFCREAAAAGIDGLILPDLPVYEFESRYGVLIKKYGLDFIFLVTPETAPQRIKKLDNLSSGFLYAVSSSSTTGSKNNLSQMPDYLEKIKLMNLQNPVLVGFGINDKASFELACGYVNGAIIGSAYIRAIQNGNNVKAATKSFLSSILSG
jgi:tryptophan synthase alpha chain